MAKAKPSWFEQTVGRALIDLGGGGGGTFRIFAKRRGGGRPGLECPRVP